MNKFKSRKGAALILALIVMIVGGALITVIFDFVSQYAFFSTEEKAGYVDHTTLVSQTQAMKGRIVSDNIAAWKTRHVQALGYGEGGTAPEAGSLVKEDLRFDDTWRVDKKTINGNGVGNQQIEVEVYDMLFDLSWIDPGALQDKDFPSNYRMMSEGEAGAAFGLPEGGSHFADGAVSGGGGGGSGGGSQGGGNGGSISLGASPDGLTPDNYGAYLVRARLYDGSGNRVVRTVEEVFLQVLPPKEE